MIARWVLLTSSFIFLTACESHSSARQKASVKQPAPIVNGAAPSRRAHIYTSRKQNERHAQNSAANATTTYAPQPAPAASIEPVALQPVSAIYLDAPAPSPSATAASPKTARALKDDIIVRPGDTVYAIARRYEVDPKAVIAANRLRHPYTLAIGQTLKLPAEARRETSPMRKIVAQDALYTVRRGDTLYAIARNSGANVQTIAQANNILPPYALTPGQQIIIPQARVDSPLFAAKTAPAANRAPERVAAAPKPQTAPKSVAELTQKASYAPTKPASSAGLFEWPVQGKIVATYGASDLGRRNDGVNIAAPVGTPVRAAAAGEVVYRGAELDGFGNLLLIKHSGGYVTAYAHNDSMLVKKGDQVRQGQVIAKVGQSGAVSSPQLHFEIRQNLKSVDPLALLDTR